MLAASRLGFGVQIYNETLLCALHNPILPPLCSAVARSKVQDLVKSSPGKATPSSAQKGDQLALHSSEEVAHHNTCWDSNRVTCDLTKQQLCQCYHLLHNLLQMGLEGGWGQHLILGESLH